jgi:hypothetical protein
MSGLQRYDHARMVEHANQQANLVTHLQGLQQDANNQIASIAEIWTQHGSNAAQECHAQISLAFGQVFDTINRVTAVSGRRARRRPTSGSAAGSALSRVDSRGARLSTTSEGLVDARTRWYQRLPVVLKLRPVGEWKRSTPTEMAFSNRPGCHGDCPDADWL